MGKKLPFYNDKPYEYDYNRKLKPKRITYKLLMPVGRILLEHIAFDKVECYGLENVPKNGGFIVASNHVSGFDPITITYCLQGKKQLFFMAKEEFFHTFYTKYPLLILNGFPVKRGTADRSAINFAIRILKSGFNLCIFPQGTRDKQQNRPEKGKSGVALIAREAKTDILPTSIYLERLPGKKKAKVIVRFGQMIPYSALGFTDDAAKSRELKNATKLIMSSIGELWDKDNV